MLNLNSWSLLLKSLRAFHWMILSSFVIFGPLPWCWWLVYPGVWLEGGWLAVGLWCWPVVRDLTRILWPCRSFFSIVCGSSTRGAIFSWMSWTVASRVSSLALVWGWCTEMVSICDLSFATFLLKVIHFLIGVGGRVHSW
jgi:hypothetical protein